MLEKLYELWSIEKRVSVTIKSVGLNCTFTTVIENIYKGEDSVVLEFGDNNMKLDVTENCTCNEYEMTVVYNETTITINWEEDYIDAFESQIINERHFGNYEDAEEFSRNVPQGTACMIAELKSPLI